MRTDTAYARNKVNEKWYDFNDSSVYEVDPNKTSIVVSRYLWLCASNSNLLTLQSREAYVLLYERRDCHGVQTTQIASHIKSNDPNLEVEEMDSSD